MSTANTDVANANQARRAGKAGVQEVKRNLAAVVFMITILVKEDYNNDLNII